MRSKLSLSVLAAALLGIGLAGCASTSSAVATEPDMAKVAAIERVAAATGVRVYWLNYPQKKVASPSGS